MDDATIDGARRLLAEIEQQWVRQGADVPAPAAEAGWSPDSETRRRILDLLRARLDSAPTAPSAEEGQSLTGLREENARLRRQLELNRTAHDYLVRLAHHFTGQEVVFEGPGQIRAFCERMKRSVGILVAEFSELLSGRKRFQKDWGLDTIAASGGARDVTRLFREEKLQGGDLGRYLFWETADTAGSSSDDLRTAIDELKHHQMALLCGLERCSKGGTLKTLEQLSPGTIELDYLEGEGTGTLLRRINPLRSGRLWREYERRYEELVGEDERWFQAKFLSSFGQGYREYMWAKKKAQCSGHSALNKGGK